MLIIPHHLIPVTKKNKFLALDEGPSEGINDSLGAAEKKKVLTLVKQRQNFVSVCISTVLIANSCICINKTEIYKFEGHDNIRWYGFCLGRVSKDFTKNDQGEISLNGTA